MESSTLTTPKAASRSWTALILGAVPLVGLAGLTAFLLFGYNPGGGPIPLPLVGGLIIAFFVCSVTSIVCGIMALRSPSDTERGWTRLRAGIGIGLGVIGILLPCAAPVFGFSTVSVSPAPPTITPLPPAPGPIAPPAP